MGGMDCIDLDRYRDRETCKCSNEPSVSVNCGEFLDWLRTG